MQDFREFFKGKKVTLMGLGLLGRSLGDAAFLSQYVGELIVTDLKSREALKPSVKKLGKYKNIKYTLGEHSLDDFRGRDLIIKGPSVPLESIYIQEACSNRIPVTMSTALFARFARAMGVKIVGVTGTRGKSTTTHLLFHILKHAKESVVLGGNVRNLSTLALLPKLKKGMTVVMELDSWQLQGFGNERLSPHISVFTTFLPDHMGYYQGSMQKYFKDKANIFKYQQADDLLVVGRQALPFVKKWGGNIKSKILVPRVKLPKGWKFDLPGVHNEYNAMLAIAVAQQLGVRDSVIKKALKTFEPLPGRLQFLRKVRGVKIYNDNSSTTPDATIAALRAVGDAKKHRVVLIIGGDNKFLDMSKLLKEIPKFCSKVVMFKERGTDTIRDKVLEFKKKGIEVYEEESLQNTVMRAFSLSQKGETLLFSPAFFSFGKHFKNEFDRGDQFVKLVKKLK